MSDAEHIAEVVRSSLLTADLGSEVAVNTQCLFPSNGIVTVYVTGGRETCTVSDRGATARAVEAHGIVVPNLARWLSTFAKRAGLVVTRNEIHSPQLPANALPAAVMLVANTAAQAARYALENYGAATSTGLLEQIEDKLVFEFGKPYVARDVELAGESNRVYHFDFQVSGAAGEKIIVDQVAPFPSSVNAKAVAHIDVGRMQDRRVRQAMVYDQTLDWNSADIIFLQSAAPTVPIERLTDAIKRKAVN